MSAPRKPRGAKLRALWFGFLLLSLFIIASASVWRDNPTINLLGYCCIVIMPFLYRFLLVSGGRAAGAGADRTEGSQAAKRPNRGTKTVGIVLVVVGIVLFAVGFLSHSAAIFVYGLASAILGIVLVRNAFDRVPSPGTASVEEVVPKTVGRFDRIMRATGIALVPLMVLSFAFLHLDAAHGYREAWPFYTFCAVGLASLLVWPYLVARAYGRWLRR